MAVAPTGAIYKALEFDGVSSRTYGVYITGEAVYNAPERDVEMVTIPGRNGTYALDNGRFENIEVSYPAGIFADTEADFRQAISEFRNFLCSRKGYVRLQDEYNPDEYRLAVYKSGLEVEPAMLKAGEFKIIFDCKPQRFLTSGETAVSVDSGDTLTNPTLFEASPMLEIVGSGKFAINGEELEITGGNIGDYIAFASKNVPLLTYSFDFDDTYALNGDPIKFNFRATSLVTLDSGTFSARASSQNSQQNLKAYISAYSNNDYMEAGVQNNTQNIFTYGTSQTRAVSLTASASTSDYGSLSLTLSGLITYDGAKNISITISLVMSNVSDFEKFTYVSDVVVRSSSSTLGNPLYFDLDLGEAYKIENGVAVSVNAGVTIPGKLPTLIPGVNTVTYDNTISSFKVTPRWWKV